jgi:3',5'-cyclic AMP phosphodiesterase CpdA
LYQWLGNAVLQDVKFIHFTDPHLSVGSPELYGLEPASRLKACVAHMAAHHGDAAFAVLTGDLTHDGSVASYQEVRALLAPLPLPVHPLIGNHDDRASFRQAFREVPADQAGFVQYIVRHGGRRFIVLDSVEAGSHGGVLDAERLAWLKQALAEDPATPCYLFLHHPPMAVGMPSSDTMAIEDPGFEAILAEAGNVRHIFFGHLHRPVSGVWRGIPFSGIPGLSHQVALDLAETDGRVRGSHEPPSYSVVLLRRDDVIIHQCHFLDDSGTFYL